MSGACTAPVRYAGPHQSAASLVGSCSDAAGNTAEVTHRFQYDATAPKLGKPKVALERRLVRISWQRPADAASVELVRAPGMNGARSSVVYRGTGRSFSDRRVRDGIRYRYTIRVADLAGNVAEATVGASPRPPLYRPAQGALVRAPIAFAWEAVEGVGFYNFQLLRNQKKVLSAGHASPASVSAQAGATPGGATGSSAASATGTSGARGPRATIFGDRRAAAPSLKAPEGWSALTQSANH